MYALSQCFGLTIDFIVGLLVSPCSFQVLPILGSETLIVIQVLKILVDKIVLFGH